VIIQKKFLGEKGSSQRLVGDGMRPMTALRGPTPAALDMGRTSISSDKMSGHMNVAASVSCLVESSSAWCSKFFYQMVEEE